MKKLNLGCGTDYKEGWVNLDVKKNVKADVYHDLNKFPYPFKKDTFDYVELNMVLEHVKKPLMVLEELWKICKPGAKIFITVPHWSSYLAYSDLTHINFFSKMSFSYFEKGNPKYYSDFANFKVLKKQCKSFRTNNKIFKPYEWLCRIIVEPIINSRSLIVEELLCKYLPVNEIDFLLEVIKNN